MADLVFHPAHLAALCDNLARHDVSFPAHYLDPAFADELALSTLAITEIDEVHGPVILSGIHPQWEGRALAWALSTPDASPRHWARHLAPSVALIERAHGLGYHRIEAVIDGEHGAGLRWVARLGFQVESMMLKYDPSGRDCFMCTRHDNADITRAG